MKPKHLSLITLLLVLLTAGLAGWYAVAFRAAESGDAGFAPIKPLSELPVPSADELAQMDMLQRSMHLLTAPPRRLRQVADLSVLGYVPLTDGGEAAGLAGRVDPDLPTHRVTLAFDGRGKRFCIIDSELYPEGAILPDGATIVKIESRRVLIAKEQRQRWLTVESLLDSALADQKS